MPLTREQFAELYRPTGPKQIATGLAATPGTQQNLVQQVDLTLPLEGLRLRLQGRDVIAGAAMASGKPEGFLNLLSRIVITGTNKRQGGNVTLYDIDLATLWVSQWLFSWSPSYFDGVSAAGAVVSDPTQPFPAVGAAGYVNTAAGTYDYRIVVDLPFYPFGAPVGVRPGFLMRNEEWLDSVQMQFTFPAVANAAVETPLGTGAALTTHTFTAYNSAAGNPTLDVESLPVEMGLSLKDQVVPGFMSRVTQPINTILQAAGNPVVLLNLQKQRTTRIIAKIGTVTTAPGFLTLSDTNLTAADISIGGGTRTVRQLLNIFDHKQNCMRYYETRMIQGYFAFDFIQSGNPDSAYPGHALGEGAVPQMRGTVAGVANAYGIIIQEMILWPPAGPLYS